MSAELSSLIDGLTVGDHLTAAGSDTRGHDVSRTGHLLAAPKAVTASRNGVPTKGWRLCVGAEGTDPADRTTWTTIFPGVGTVEHTPEPEPGQWANTELRMVPGVRSRSHTTRFLYGGKGGARSPQPTQSTPVTVFTSTDGLYDLRDAKDGTTYASLKLASTIWWAHLPKDFSAATPPGADARP